MTVVTFQPGLGQASVSINFAGGEPLTLAEQFAAALAADSTASVQTITSSESISTSDPFVLVTADSATVAGSGNQEVADASGGLTYSNTVQGSTVQVALDGSKNYLTFGEVTATVAAGAGDDTISGSANDVTFYGAPGADLTLNDPSEYDNPFTVVAGSGEETIYAADAASGVNVFTDGGEDSITGSSGYDYFDIQGGDTEVTAGTGFADFIITATAAPSQITINDFGAADFIAVQGTYSEDTILEDAVVENGSLTLQLSPNNSVMLVGVTSLTGHLLDPGLPAITLCYVHGTRILSPTGQKPVEDLAIGDAVVTRFRGIQRIKWLGRQSYAPAFIGNNKEKWPVCIQAGALEDGVPARDLFVSPGHSMLLGDVLVLASTLVNGSTITQTRPETDVHYVQIELSAHDCVIAEGAWSETYADAPGQRAQFHNAAEYAALYPDEPPAEELRLCAERPERGPRLAAALLPVVRRAWAGLAAGPLAGSLDNVSKWRLEGWALDRSHPALPVMLEALLDGQVIGAFLACDNRVEVPQAGFGSACRGFSWIAPVRLPEDPAGRLLVRRTNDGTSLPKGATLQATQSVSERF